jgi:hypothetical protein
MDPNGSVVFSSKIDFNVRTGLVLCPLDRALLRADLVPNLAVNRSHAVVGSVNRTDLVLNRIRATVPLTGQGFGVLFLGGHISLKNRTYRPLLIDRACPFKNMCVHT